MPKWEVQLETHRQKLAEYDALRQLDTGTGPRGAWLALDLGIRHERETVLIWAEHARAASEEVADRSQ